MSVDAILKEIEALSDAERELFFQRLDELYPGPILTPELKALLDARVAAADANPDTGIPWEVVYEESLKRARK